MNPKTVAILLVLLAVAVVILLSPQFMTPSGEPRYDTSQDVPAIPDTFLGSKLTKITIPAKSGHVDLEQRNGQWWVKYPHEFPANTKQINEFLQQISELAVTPPGEPITDVIPNSSDPVVYLANSEEQAYLIRLVRRMGAGRTQIEIESDEVEGLYNANDVLHKVLEELISANYFASSPDALLLPDVRQIEITTDGSTSTLQQVDNKWWIDKPQNSDPALEQGLPDAPGVSTFLELHNTLELIEQQSYPLTDSGLPVFGLNRPLISVTFKMQDGQAWQLKIGVPADPQDKTRYVSYGPSEAQYPAVFTMDTQTAIAFGQDATVFRDPRIITTPVALIERILLIKDPPDENNAIIIIRPDQILLVDKKSGTPEELDKNRLATMLNDLASARALSFVSLETIEIDLIRTVAIKHKLQGEVEVFKILNDPMSNPDRPTILIRRDNEPTALRVPTDVVAGLLDAKLLIATDAE